MFLKAFGLLVPLAAGGLWAAGAFDRGYHRDVDRPPEQVMAALEEIDVRGEPGAPGTDPAASGGVEPLFRTERTADTVSLVVMSGDKVATRMTAHLQPLDGGRRTRVTASVQRGDAPDDFVSPAFRSKGITLGLFSMALESRLNALTAPPQRSRADCQELEQKLLLANAPQERPASLGQAVGSTAKTVMTLQAVEAELRRQGCSAGGGGGFEPVEEHMGRDTGAPPPTDPKVSFEPGKPMVDPATQGP
jgi:hypothetical protein